MSHREQTAPTHSHHTHPVRAVLDMRTFLTNPQTVLPRVFVEKRHPWYTGLKEIVESGSENGSSIWLVGHEGKDCRRRIGTKRELRNPYDNVLDLVFAESRECAFNCFSYLFIYFESIYIPADRP